jgi:small subunit ribosomal protein S18
MNSCYFCSQNIEKIDYQDTDILKKFISFQFKIQPSKKTKLCAKHQRQLSKAIKKARVLGLLPFTGI